MLTLAVSSQTQGAVGVTPVATLYVDQRATPGGNGQSWQTAFSDLQDALTWASRLPTSGQSWKERLIEIRIAQGTYTPDVPNGNRDRSFDLGLVAGSAPVVSLRGSFAGLGSSDPDTQDFISTTTVLSGDLNGDDGPDWSNRADNSRTILSAERVLHGYIELEGLEFSGASHMEPNGSSGPNYPLGGALRVSVADGFSGTGMMVLNRCTFRDNQTMSSDGAGLLAFASDYVIQDCRFERNRTLSGKGGGATIYSNYYLGAFGRVERSYFAENSAKYGGALFLQSSTTILECDFRNNSASVFGGALYCTSGSGLNSVLMVRNAAGSAGGGVFSATSDLLGVSMTTFASNSAPDGAAIHSMLGPLGMYASIVWDSAFGAGGSAIDLGYGVFDSWIVGSILRGGESAIAFAPGTLSIDNAIDVDPLFIRPAADGGGDVATWNYRLRPGSPAAALSGNMNGLLQDLDGVNFGCPMPWESWGFDAGCYFADSCVCWANLDADWDGLVDDEDFQLFVDAYNIMISPPALPRADLNRDGLVDDADFQIFAAAYDALTCQ